LEQSKDNGNCKALGQLDQKDDVRFFVQTACFVAVLALVKDDL